jgi:protein-disulfide isomerase
MLCAAVTVIWQNWRSAPVQSPERSIALPREAIDISRAPIKGNPNAAVGIVEYSDFECPYCERFSLSSLPELDREYLSSGRALMAFKHLPLPIHQSADAASQAAVCAHEQGMFWPMHDQLFANRDNLKASTLRVLAGDVGLDLTRYDECGRAGRHKEAVDDDKREAATLGITGTPTFLFGTVQQGKLTVSEAITGARSVSEFKRILDALLARTSV